MSDVSQVNSGALESESATPGLRSGEIKVVAFLCHWCAYAGADCAGVHQLPLPPELSAVRIMCSGQVEPGMILEAFHLGADGVMVLACHFGDCHYKMGNVRALHRTLLLEPLLAQLGIDPARFRLDFVSATEMEKFSQICTLFVAHLRAMRSIS